jgi:hypothetical protein
MRLVKKYALKIIYNIIIILLFNYFNLISGIPTIKISKIEDSFQNNMNYRKISNKFQLPEIKNKVPLIINRNMDTKPYDRVK